jgi:hypothetical protein
VGGTKYLKGECSHCGGHLEFPVDAVGMTADCPHCGKQTELLLATPKDEGGIPTRIVVWTIVAVLVLGAGLGAAMYALKRAQRWAEARKQVAAPIQNTNVVATNAAPAPPAPDPIAEAGFRVSEIKLEKENSVVHAVGTLQNATTNTRYGVKIELDILDSDGKKIGTTSDLNRETIDPNGKWTFHALVLGRKAASAKATGVSEQQ